VWNEKLMMMAVVAGAGQAGVTVFVCLMEESEFGKHGKHYFDVAKSMLDSRPSDFVKKVRTAAITAHAHAHDTTRTA
jgi:hypothetical protein